MGRLNPRNPQNIVAIYQHDRYSSGAAKGNVSSASFDGGLTWTQVPLPADTVCTGGKYDRATDQPAGVKVLRVESGLFFANTDSVRARVRAHASGEGVRAIVLDAATMPFVDVSAVRMLEELADELERRGVRLLVARDIGQVRDVLRRAGGDADLTRLYPTIDAAVGAALAN